MQLSSIIYSFSSQSGCCSGCVNGRLRISIFPADRITALCEWYRRWRLNLEHEDQAVAAAKSERTNAVVSRTLYLVSKTHPALMPAPGEQASDGEIAPPFGWDAPIAVWWDQPPCEDL